MNRSNTNQQQQSQKQMVFFALAAAATASLLYYYYTVQKVSAEEDEYDELGKKVVKKKPTDAGTSSATKHSEQTVDSSRDSVFIDGVQKSTTASANDNAVDEKQLHALIEEMDKRGKALFKNKQVRRVFATNLEIFSFRRLILDHFK
jgi:hypothetical protein